MTFVEVQHARRDIHRRECANAADTQQQFLADADALVPSVQPGRQLPVFRTIPLDVGIEQEERVPADRQLPDAGADRSGAGLDGDRDRRTVVPGRLQGGSR